MDRITSVASCLLLASSPSAWAQVVDEFDEDPRASLDWELYEPAASAEYSTEDGFFRVTIPAGINLDTWTAVDRGIQLRRSDLPEDFVVETRVRFLGSGDPLNPVFPPSEDAYLASLMVYFSTFDVFHWGFQLGTNLANQRIGNTVPRCDHLNDADEVSLRIRKRGTSYTFSWRLTDGEPWIDVCERQVAEPAVSVGLIFKTWGPGIAERQTFLFDYFRILEDPSPKIGGFVPAAGDNFHDAAAGFQFDVNAVEDGVTIETVELLLNDVDVTGDLAIGGTPEARRVRYEGLEEGIIYSAWIIATDSEGNVGEAMHSFGTLSPFAGELVDEFDDSPLDDPSWELYDPLAAGTYGTNDGFFRVVLPAGVNLDHWIAADRAIQLRRYDIPQDFIIETRIRFQGSGDPPLWPPSGETYIASLMVQFSRFDVFHWGFRQGTNLAIQRSGQGAGFCQFDPGLQEVSLRVRKVGAEYTFGWRSSDGEDWVDQCFQAALEAPVSVGLMLKSWNPLITLEETFDFDYFKMSEVPLEPARISRPCVAGEADRAWLGMPYRRTLLAGGFPEPEVRIVSGPVGLLYDPASGELIWIPSEPGLVSIDIEASNDQGSESARWDVEVFSDPAMHDDEFDSDPRENAAFWELWELQPGVGYSIVEEDGSSWFRMDVPQLGEFGENFDTWIGADRAPQLRFVVDDAEDFLIETRVRISPENAPPPSAPFLAGLLVYFGDSDILHWNVGQERAVGFEFRNLFLERSGINDIAHGFVDSLLEGTPVDLRIERNCEDYNCLYRADGASEWILAGTYSTSDPPLLAGIVMKTWAEGAAFTVDFDYFDVVTPDGSPASPRFVRGDADASGAINLTDGVSALNWLFLGAGEPACLDAADADDSGRVNLTDAVRIFNWLFTGGPAPLAPSPGGAIYAEEDCGVDPTDDDTIGCRVAPRPCQ